MSLVSDIISQAYRETNLIPLGNAPNTNQTAEALVLLNTIILSTVGLEVGDDLNELNMGGLYDESFYTSSWVPRNARLILNLSGPTTLALDPDPVGGQRLAIADVAGNLATYPLTLTGNGRKIEGANTLVLNVNSDSRQWLYRSDIGTWVKITGLISTDTFPFPAGFDDFFITMLAMRLNPRYGQTLSQESAEALKRGRKHIRVKYRGKTEVYPEYVGIIGDNRYTSFGVNEFGRGYYRWR